MAANKKKRGDPKYKRYKDQNRLEKNKKRKAEKHKKRQEKNATNRAKRLGISI